MQFNDKEWETYKQARIREAGRQRQRGESDWIADNFLYGSWSFRLWCIGGVIAGGVYAWLNIRYPGIFPTPFGR